MPERELARAIYIVLLALKEQKAAINMLASSLVLIRELMVCDLATDDLMRRTGPMTEALNNLTMPDPEIELTMTALTQKMRLMAGR